MNKSIKRKANRVKDPFEYYPDQAWSCDGCGKCCTMWDIPVTLEEKKRLEKLIIPGYDFENEEYFIQNKSYKHLFLIKKKDNKCIFLDDDGLCIIHKLHGEPVKALACRLYPFHILKWDDGTPSVSFRFDCKAVSENRGTKIGDRLGEMRALSTELEKGGKRSRSVYNRDIKPQVSSLRIIAKAYKDILFEPSISMAAKLNYCARLLDFHSAIENKDDILEPQKEFSNDAVKYVKENRENLEYAIEGSEEGNKLQRMIFNYVLSGYARVDEEVLTKRFIIGRVSRAYSILKFILNRGSLSELGADYPNTKGSSSIDVMQSIPIKKDGENILMRYFAVQLNSLHFCGNPGLNLTFEEGMRHLLLLYPITVAIAGLNAKENNHEFITAKDIAFAIRITDHTFYHSPFFALKHVKKMVKWLTNDKNFPTICRFADLENPLISASAVANGDGLF